MNNIKEYGFSEFFENQISKFNITSTDLIPARVIEVQKEQYKIVTEYGENDAKLKGSLFYNDKIYNEYPTVGDYVLAKHNPMGEDIIYYVFERKSKFSRLDSYNKVEQIVAANFDYVFIMLSLNNDFNIKRTERYLTAAWQSGASPVIIMTKLDLCDDYDSYREKVSEIAPFVPIIGVSSVTGEGLEELESYVQEAKTIVFLGSSGIGKSSLVNALCGEKIMKVNTIREDDSKGRHTTTHRQLITLKNHAMVIDTPGMRELGMWDVSEGLDVAFEDIEELSKKCKFNDCSHEKEPGCAVKAALESGELSIKRWNNYLKLKKESEFAKYKESMSVRLRKKALWKNVSKFQKELKKKY
ncbi:ribosome small subunit-dependent GTPase A [Clostridium chromiireducens]|uniref:Small ribosomal subunit biogenesis GTPase RsgA n=1 Tax=Clostridium chromiireducens TaxID=225345 RepID=A0A964RRX9_9CLOT|nr:ribosome small subunit-dependent GTPase A [Clostridium chromiireducens]MVX66508.1 ribosome small subunit-dependent GTPase A [Clostridium chromiireducens]